MKSTTTQALILVASCSSAFGQSEFTMPAAPTNDIAADFAGVPAANLQNIVDTIGTSDPAGLGDVAAPSATASSAWDIGDVTFAYDRIDQCLWVGVQFGNITGGPVDFATPDGGGDAANLFLGEFLTGAIDLDNDNQFDLWFGVAQDSDATQFATAAFVGGPGTPLTSGVSFVPGGGAFGVSPSMDLGISSWTTGDSVGGEDSFQFKLDLAADASIAALLPAEDEDSIFTVRVDAGSGNDLYGEDTLNGTITFPALIPEPSSAALLALSLGMCLRRRR